MVGELETGMLGAFMQVFPLGRSWRMRVSYVMVGCVQEKQDLEGDFETVLVGFGMAALGASWRIMW